MPYSDFEVFLASAVRQAGQEPNALRRLFFERATGINKPTDREALARTNNIFMRYFAAYNRTKNIIIGLDDAYRLTRKDFGAVRRELTDAGSLPSSVDLITNGGNLVLHWRTDFPRYAVAFEMTGRAGRDTSLPLLMTVLNEAGDLLASGPIRPAFLDVGGHCPSFDALRQRCTADASYASAILAYFTDAWSTDTASMKQES